MANSASVDQHWFCGRPVGRMGIGSWDEDEVHTDRRIPLTPCTQLDMGRKHKKIKKIKKPFLQAPSWKTGSPKPEWNQANWNLACSEPLPRLPWNRYCFHSQCNPSRRPPKQADHPWRTAPSANPAGLARQGGAALACCRRLPARLKCPVRGVSCFSPS